MGYSATNSIGIISFSQQNEPLNRQGKGRSQGRLHGKGSFRSRELGRFHPRRRKRSLRGASFRKAIMKGAGKVSMSSKKEVRKK